MLASFDLGIFAIASRADAWIEVVILHSFYRKFCIASRAGMWIEKGTPHSCYFSVDMTKKGIRSNLSVEQMPFDLVVTIYMLCSFDLFLARVFLSHNFPIIVFF